MLALQALDAASIRGDFPIFTDAGNGRPLVYLDSASTAQKPRHVLEAMQQYYEQRNANVHRGVYELSELSTEQYESARERVAAFVHAMPQETIFTGNATQAINAVAYSYGLRNLAAGDNVVLSVMEHHSNFVPWQQLCALRGAELRVAGIDDEGNLNIEQIRQLVDRRTRMVAVSQMSNVLGTLNDIRAIAGIAHDKGSVLLVDGAQSVPHLSVDVKKLGCDFLAFSGHKMLGPMGIGVLYGKHELLHAMEPFLFGGGMIHQVTVQKTSWAALPWKFEAGTPNVAGAVGLSAAVDYLTGFGMDAVWEHGQQLLRAATKRLSGISGLTVHGTAPGKGGILSFTLDGIHPHDLATIAASRNICIRAGHHCCQPLMERLGVAATARASFYLYNDAKDIDALAEAVEEAKKVFAR